MKLPADVVGQILRDSSLGFDCTSDGKVVEGFEKGWGGIPYPPPGFLRWAILEIGNGDCFGYYWPIGKENDDPIVCVTMHDSWELVPVASSLARCLRLQFLTGWDFDDLKLEADSFSVPLDDLPPRESDDDDSAEFDESAVPSDDVLYGYDPESPQLCLSAAKASIARRDLTAAKEQLTRALSRLPEYAEAWALSAQVCRQQQNLQGAAAAMMQALTAPICFGAGDRKRLLGALQRMNDAARPAEDDPLWDRRSELTFSDGVKEKHDYTVFEELIAAYHERGLGVRAIRLRILAGELMGHETISFQERQHWDWNEYWRKLRADLETAGLADRVVCL
jgi:tetratricopeptide (TPR) repeat protein